MLKEDLLRGYPQRMAEALAEYFGYVDITGFIRTDDWAEDYEYYHCSICDWYKVRDLVSSEDGGATWVCRSCAKKGDGHE